MPAPAKLSFLDRHLSLWIALAIVVGMVLSIVWPDLPHQLQRFSIQGISLEKLYKNGGISHTMR